MNKPTQQFSGWLTLFSSALSLAILITIILLPIWYVVLGAIILWLGIFAFMYVRLHVPGNQVSLYLMSALSFIILLLLVESSLIRWLIILCSSLVFFFISYWSQPRITHAIHLKEKPLRRMVMMLHVFNVYAWMVGLFAFNLYFPQIQFVYISLLGAVYAGINVYLIWELYFKAHYGQLIVWSLLIGLGVFELMWVLRLLPYGYLVSGFLVVWVWYLFQLFIRFHLSPRGIMWDKQYRFIAFNVILFIIIMFSIQWI